MDKEQKTIKLDDIESFAKANGLVLVDNVWQLVDVDLYTEERYRLRYKYYWMWSPTLKRLDRREFGEWSTWRVLKEYLGLIYIEDDRN